MAGFHPTNREIQSGAKVSYTGLRATKHGPNRVDYAVDIYVKRIGKLLRGNVLRSVKVIRKMLDRALIEVDKPRPSATIIGNARAAAVATLSGTGVFAEHQIISNRPLDADRIADIIDRAESIRAEIALEQGPSNPVNTPSLPHDGAIASVLEPYSEPIRPFLETASPQGQPPTNVIEKAREALRIKAEGGTRGADAGPDTPNTPPHELGESSGFPGEMHFDSRLSGVRNQFLDTDS